MVRTHRREKFLLQTRILSEILTRPTRPKRI
uniref:Uncharacterized protein n=1 Tax=Anguilla anguilla TaxID=7936 RepID=A0A0E9U7P9_ANGAN